MLFLFWASICFIIGACFGSFLNVVIYRLPKMLQMSWRNEAKLILGEPVIDEGEAFNLAVPASTCPHCGVKIKPQHNIPILGYLLIGGKCANCSSAISIRYPVIELMSALLALFIFFRFGLSIEGLALSAFTFALMALVGIDFDHKLLPDSLTLPLLWLGLLVNLDGLFVSLEEAVIGAMFGYLSLWSVYWLFKWIAKKEGMGFGDFKLMAAMGAWFGWQIIPSVILMSSILGAIFGVMQMLLFKQKEDAAVIPYGPFIAVATWLLFFFPQTNVFFTF